MMKKRDPGNAVHYPPDKYNSYDCSIMGMGETQKKDIHDQQIKTLGEPGKGWENNCLANDQKKSDDDQENKVHHVNILWGLVAIGN